MTYDPKSPQFQVIKRAWEIWEYEPDKSGGKGRFWRKFSEDRAIVDELIKGEFLTEFSPDYLWSTEKLLKEVEEYQVKEFVQQVPNPQDARFRGLKEKVVAGKATQEEKDEIMVLLLKKLAI